MEPKFHEIGEFPPEGVNWANIDCEQHKDICARNLIDRYPRIKYIVDGKTVSEYDMDYNVVEMRHWGEKMSR
ncbi:MAG: hypothetical protein EZS28_056190, partial [Streblomastix strix]